MSHAVKCDGCGRMRMSDRPREARGDFELRLQTWDRWHRAAGGRMYCELCAPTARAEAEAKEARPAADVAQGEAAFEEGGQAWAEWNPAMLDFGFDEGGDP